MKSKWSILWVVAVFSIAMAALESAVVVYLRALYYPNGFTVAMKMMDESILMVEITREAATIVMLWAIGFLTGKGFKERLAYFLFSFAVWDIFYYVWLKVFIDWPSSLWEWDILFLIPITWLGPVLAPVICSLTMILLAAILLWDKVDIKFTHTVWGLLVIGSLLILFTFMQDYGSLLIQNGYWKEINHVLHNPSFIQLASNYLPNEYNWGVFWAGETLIGLGIVQILKQAK